MNRYIDRGLSETTITFVPKPAGMGQGSVNWLAFENIIQCLGATGWPSEAILTTLLPMIDKTYRLDFLEVWARSNIREDGPADILGPTIN